MITMKDLEQCFKDARYADSMFVGIKVQSPDCPEPEYIINPRENFEAKLEYYKRSYNDDLTLKSFNKIKIVGCYFGDCWDELECYFEDSEL